MSDLIQFTPERVLTLTGLPAPGAAYRATFYLSGTTTPVTVYQDDDALVPHSSPVLANSNGVFPAVFAADGAGAIKAVITTSAGGTYATIDPVARSPLTASTAAQIGFAPTDDILSTDVQDAIESVRAVFDDDIAFVDNQMATFGTGADMQIFHNGTDSFIRDTGSGAIVIQTNGTEVVIRSDTPETMARFSKDGAVELFHNGVKVFETTATGITVTGNIATTGTITTRRALLANDLASGVSGANFPTGSFAALVVDQEVSDTAGMVTLAANQITFAAAGTYLIRAEIEAYNASGGTAILQTRLYSVTDTAVIAAGTGSTPASSRSSSASVEAIVTLTASEVVEFQGIADVANVQQGVPTTFGAHVGARVYIERLA